MKNRGQFACTRFPTLYAYYMKPTWFLVKHAAGVRGGDDVAGRDLGQRIRRLQGADFRLGDVQRRYRFRLLLLVLLVLSLADRLRQCLIAAYIGTHNACKIVRDIAQSFTDVGISRTISSRRISLIRIASYVRFASSIIERRFMFIISAIRILLTFERINDIYLILI